MYLCNRINNHQTELKLTIKAMKTKIEFTGRTNRTIVYKAILGSLMRTMIVYPNGSAEVYFSRITNN